jgi:hypothetical protein
MLPFGEKNPRFRPCFYLLDRSPIEGDALVPSKIRDVKLKSRFSRLCVELGQ